MDLLQPYRGQYCSAQSAESKLDIMSILQGCSEVDDEARYMGRYSNELNLANNYLDEKSLSVDGKTMQGEVDDCRETIESVQESITNTTSQIRDAAVSAYNSIQEQLNYEAQVRDQNEWNQRNRR